MNAMNLYLLTLTFISPPHLSHMFVEAESSIEALHILQRTLTASQRQRLADVAVEVFDYTAAKFVRQNVDRMVVAWLAYLKTI